MFWKNKRVLITGHTGFKGSWLSLWLQALGADVIGFALAPPTSPNLFTLADVSAEMLSIIGDIRDYHQVYQAIKDHRPEIVFHMAAQPLVRYAYQNPIETYATNVMGTVHLLEAVRHTESVKVVVNVTTDKCYENKEWHWGYRENDRLGGHDPYSNSKACAELVAAAFRNSYFQEKTCGVNLASARAGNVIGGGDWALDRLVPDLIQACLNNNPLFIRNPHSIRPWQYVLEPLSGYLLLAQKMYGSPMQFTEGWNFGPEETDVRPVSWVADYILNIWNSELKWTHDSSKQPHEATYLKLDCSKAKSKLGWQPKWGLQTGLEETVSWYKAYQMKQNLREITLNQIQRFMA